MRRRRSSRLLAATRTAALAELHAAHAAFEAQFDQHVGGNVLRAAGDAEWLPQGNVETARRQGDGFAPVRGLRRLGRRFFGGDITPPARRTEPRVTAS